MPSTVITQKGQRGSRVKLGGSILALVLLENGRQIRGRLNQLSLNGGLISLEQPLDEGISVTVLFHVGSTSIRSNGASVGSVVNTHSVIELVESNRSSWTITAGRGLPA